MNGAGLRNRTCLVTGAAGFIGSHLVRRLVDEGAKVHAFIRSGTSIERLGETASRITIHRVDLQEAEQTAECVRDIRPEAVFHLAARTRGGIARSAEVAASSTDRSLEPLIGLVGALDQLPVPPEILVRAGTIAEYGDSPLPYCEANLERPVTPYGAAKLAGTQMLSGLSGKLRFPTVTARLALTYGPMQDRGFFVPALMEACLEGREFFVRHPEDRRDLIHVSDVINALLLMARHTRPGGAVVNVSTGYAPSMREVAQTAVAVTGCDPALIDLNEGAAANDGTRELRSDFTLARRLYGWQPATGLAQGLGLLMESQTQQPVAARQCHG